MTGAGLDLGTSEYRVEANAFFESRLRLVYAFVLGAAVFFYLLGYTTTLIEYGTAAANPWRWGRWIHLLGIGGLGSAYWMLRTKGPFGERALNRFDAFLVLGTVATCFGLFDDAGLAGQAVLAMAGKHPDWWVKAGSRRFCFKPPSSCCCPTPR